MVTQARKVYTLIQFEDLPSVLSTFQGNLKTMVSLDTETTGLDPLKSKVVTIQFGHRSQAYILDTRPYYSASETTQGYYRSLVHTLIRTLETCSPIVGHNLKFDWKMLKANFQVSMDRVADTMLQELVIHGIGLGNYALAVNMEDTGERYGIPVSKGLQKWSVGLDTRQGWNEPFPEDFLSYCSQDVYVPLKLYDLQQKALENKDLEETALLENACVPAVAKMELDGMYVDRPKYEAIISRKKQEEVLLRKDLQEALTPCIHKFRQEAYEENKADFEAWEQALKTLEARLERDYLDMGKQGLLPGTWAKFKQEGLKQFRAGNKKPPKPELDLSPINLASPAQLKQALSAIGVHVASTDKEALEPYAPHVPLVKKLLEWKEEQKFLTAFGDKLLAKIGDDGRLHPNYSQLGADTGRFTCSNPNSQQFPSHFANPEDNIRKCFVGEGDNVLLTADFDNIEYRILTDRSQDENLLAFFKKGGDLHSTTARLMFSLPEESNPKEMDLKPGLSYRQVAKQLNYGLAYGMSPFSLSLMLGVDLAQAEDLFNKYFEAYPGVKAYLEDTAENALRNGYSETIAGRKRFYALLPEPVYDPEEMTWEDFRQARREWYATRGKYSRRAKNAGIQGTNADITKYTLALLYRHLPSYVRIVACIHDEVVLECPAEKANAVAKILASAMYKACKRYLHTVHIPPVNVMIEKYWKKG